MRQILLYLFILCACSVNAERFMITGTVVDESHEPLIGAGVIVVGTHRVVCTDIDGNFSIDVEKGAILNFSYVGYNSKEVEVLNDSSLFIELVPKGGDIENVVGTFHCFDPPIPKLYSLDFSLPVSELKNLPFKTGLAVANEEFAKPITYDKMIVRIAEIEVYPQYLEEYLEFANEVDRLSVEREPGVICLFPMQSPEDPTQIRILEIYASDAAYQSHLKTDHFQKYKQGTLHMVKSLNLPTMRPLDPSTMNLIFKKK